MDHTIALIQKSHEGDDEARAQLVEENTGLVWCIVRRFAGRGTEMEDLFQIGTIGLLKAIDKFDLSFEVKFSTYAVPLISGEIKRFLRDDGMIKVSRSLKELSSASQMPKTAKAIVLPLSLRNLPLRSILIHSLCLYAESQAICNPQPPPEDNRL